MSELIKIPQSLHVFTEDCEPGDTIVLFERDKDGGYAELGHVFNAEDFPCLEEEQVEEADKAARAFAKKIVRAYNAYDDLLAALKALHAVVKTVPEMNNGRFDHLGIQVNAAIAKAEGESA